MDSTEYYIMLNKDDNIKVASPLPPKTEKRDQQYEARDGKTLHTAKGGEKSQSEAK